jgi:hypothetical protein
MFDKFHDLRRHYTTLGPRWSLVAGVFVWGIGGWEAAPSFASYLPHLVLLPIAILIHGWQCHREGRQEMTREHIQSTRE